jgi:hypothetical protein
MFCIKAHLLTVLEERSGHEVHNEPGGTLRMNANHGDPLCGSITSKTHVTYDDQII